MDLNTLNTLWDAAVAENKANENKVIDYLMAELWKREQETIKLFDTLTYDAYQAAHKAQQEYDREQREIERAAEQKLAAEINAKIKVG